MVWLGRLFCQPEDYLAVAAAAVAALDDDDLIQGPKRLDWD